MKDLQGLARAYGEIVKFIFIYLYLFISLNRGFNHPSVSTLKCILASKVTSAISFDSVLLK